MMGKEKGSEMNSEGYLMFKNFVQNYSFIDMHMIRGEFMWYSTRNGVYGARLTSGLSMRNPFLVSMGAIKRQ